MSTAPAGSRVVTAGAGSGDPSRRSGIPRAVWLLTGLHVALLVLYSVLVPAFRAPDEYVHVDLVLRLAAGDGYPDYDEGRVAAPVFRARDTSPAHLSFAPAVGADAATPRADRPSFGDLGPDEPTDVVNPMPQHPPLYYGLAGGFVAALDALAGAGDWPWDRLVASLRLLDVALVAPLPLLTWFAARRLRLPQPGPVVAAALVLCIPSLTHIGSVVNNDDLLVLLGAVLTVLVARIVTGDRSWACAVGSGVVLGLALLTKGFALVLVPWLAAAYALAAARSPDRRAVAGRGAAALAIAFVVGGWWWLRNLVVVGRLLPAVGLRDRVPVDPDPLEFVSGFADRLLSGVWGSFGWREVELPLPIVLVATAALLAAAVAVVRRRQDRSVHLLLLAPVVLLALLLGANAYRAYLKTGVPYASQGRYLFAGLAGVVVVAAAASSVLSQTWRRRAPLLVLSVGLALHAASIIVITGRYWTGWRVGALLAFSPWPEPAVAVAAAVVAVLAAVAAASLRPGRLPHEATRPAATREPWAGPVHR